MAKKSLFEPPVAHLSTYLGQEFYLHSFFTKLAKAGITTTDHLKMYREDEIFRIAKTSDKNKERFLRYVREGFIELKK